MSKDRYLPEGWFSGPVVGSWYNPTTERQLQKSDVYRDLWVLFDLSLDEWGADAVIGYIKADDVLEAIKKSEA